MGNSILIHFVTLLCAMLWCVLAFFSLWFTSSTRIRDWWPALGTVVLPFAVSGVYLWQGWRVFSVREVFLLPWLPPWLQPWLAPWTSGVVLAIPGVLALAFLGPAFFRAMFYRAPHPSGGPRLRFRATDDSKRRKHKSRRARRSSR